MERNQFTFYRSYYEALKHLPKRDRAEVLMAVISYALDEVEPSLSGVPLSVFTLIKPTLDTGRNKAKNRQNKTKTKREQNGNEGEREKEGEGEEEKEGEREYEGEDDNLAREAVAAVMSAYMDKINPTLSQGSLDELSAYARSMGAAVCLKAIDVALDAGKANWSYIRAILRSKQSQGVRCLADWERLEHDREKIKPKCGRQSWADLAAQMDAEEGFM